MNPTGIISHIAGSDLTAHLRVKISSGVLAVAGISDGKGVCLGTLDARGFNGQLTPVRARNHPGSRFMVASKAIAAGVKVWSAASGKVSDTDGGSAIVEGVSLTAAGADGDLVEVLTDPG